MHRLARLAILPFAALALNGCAAATLPALAGEAILHSVGTGDEKAAAETATTPAPAVELVEGSAPPASPGTRNSAAGDFSSFARFARNKAFSAKIDGQAISATLLNPGMLDGERARCDELPPAVLIDLDREDESFDMHETYHSPPALAADLKTLRDGGMVVGWISTANIDQIGAIRYALSQSGLDPAGDDQLLLMQHPDDRKQTRREEFGKSHCIVAIAGDTLADFDELFLFLTNPDAAKSLHALVGDGWFITPLALTKKMGPSS